MRYGKQDERLVLYPEGRLTSNNAESVWQEISRIIGSGGPGALTLDCEKLEYVSSAGLRLFIRLKKTVPDMELVNVSSEIYDILEMTGLTEMFTHIFKEMTDKGLLRKDDPKMLAFSYIAPISTLIHLCDREPEKTNKAISRIKEFSEHFAGTYGA